MKSKLFFILCSIFIRQDLSAQQVGHTTVTFVDSSRSNRQIATEIYYPAIAAGNNTPIAAGVFPLITFGHGFVMTWSAYQNFWDTLVPEGYILVFPTTESGFSPVHADFGEDLRFLITKIQSSGAGTLVPQTSVGITSAVMGHSMGGGSSFLGAENNSAITAMVSFAAANTNPSSIAASQQVSVPTLLFSGSNDCVTPPPQHQDIMYDSTAAAYKTQVYITGGGHCYFANSNFNCTFGEATCSPSPAITRAEQQLAVNDFLKPWLAWFLKGDCAKAQEFQDSLSVSPRITYRQSQPIACPSGITESNPTKNIVSVFPNPTEKFLTIELGEGKVGFIFIYDVTKKKVLEHALTNPASKTSIKISSLKSGIYFVRVNDRHWAKFLKK
jgi:hypothetical protein